MTVSQKFNKNIRNLLNLKREETMNNFKGLEEVIATDTIGIKEGIMINGRMGREKEMETLSSRKTSSKRDSINLIRNNY